MSLPEKNRVCFFCKHSNELNDGFVWCQNSQIIHERRVAKYGTRRINIIAGEARTASSCCIYFEEETSAANKLVYIKLTGKYRKNNHEK